MRINRLIGILAIFGVVCSSIFLIVFFTTSLPVFLSLAVGTWLIVGALWQWRTIRGMVRSIQQQDSNKQRNVRPATRIWSGLKGIILILIAGLVSVGMSHLHLWWLDLVADSFVAGLTCFGIALIIYAVRPKVKHGKMQILIKQTKRQIDR